MGLKIQWSRYEAGTWLPRDHNDFHDCALYVTTYQGRNIHVRRTKDGHGWTAGYGKHRTREAAFWHAVSLQSRLKVSHDG